MKVDQVLLTVPIEKELHLICCTRLELNIVTWSMKILKVSGGMPYDQKYEKLDALITFPEVFSY